MSAVVREKIKGSGEWWLFINHRGRRGSKKVGPNKTTAQIAADIINIRLVLREFGLDLRNRNKNKPVLLRLEDVIQLKSRLAGAAKSAIHSEIPLWALEIVEHQVLWEGVNADREGKESPVYTGEEILEAAAGLVEEYGTLKEYDRVQTALYKAASLKVRSKTVKPSLPARPKPETSVNPEKFPTETHEDFSKSDPKPPSQNKTGSSESQLRQQALPARSPTQLPTEPPEASVTVKPKRERILYEQTRKRKEYKDDLRARYSPRMGYGR